jgi:hypothetical protein
MGRVAGLQPRRRRLELKAMEQETAPMPFGGTDLRIPEIDPATYQSRRTQAAMRC